ncbi:hypothetical protein ACF3NS_06035 [Arsenicicoccus cauae]|uniref:DUF2244 domain-containing protein n=1 Tax=Arsenicicoccus cauae TaxID=2663847 RepID=A0A6I3IW14_9MICO|nr:hypothetical protein [Arsenicicoccus cauae]MTB72511.1 hypothetical protein [Arsenicicoccus cauae]
METLDHDGGPVVTSTPELVRRLAEAIDGPTRRKARAFEIVLVGLTVVAAVVVALSGGSISWWLALAPAILALVLVGADVGRRRRVTSALGRQERFALRYDAPARLVRFPLSGTEHPLDRFRRARVTDDGVLVLERRDNTRTPLPVDAIPADQRDSLLADLDG